MEAVSKTRNLDVSPSKVRLVANQVRGMGVERALQTLAFSRKRVAGVVATTLRSAIANAENNLGLDVDTLVVSRIFVDEGPVLKRIQPRARGRAFAILKRTSHLTVAVGPSREA